MTESEIPLVDALALTIRRTTVEEAFIRIPVTEEMVLVMQGKSDLSLEQYLRRAAARIGAEPGVEWTLEAAPVIEPHPMQKPPPEFEP